MTGKQSKEMRIIPADNRHFTDFGWLKTYWLFSFSDYHDPDNVRLGMLRVFNDDLLLPGTGFPDHPHHDMEIVTIVLDGKITHEDSMGNRGVIKTNEVQRMSAGMGLTHSEYNLSDKPLHFYQIWIYPNKRGLDPSYDQKSFAPSEWKNRLLPLASGQGKPGTVILHTDATIYRADLDAGKTLEFKTESSRCLFIYLSDGKIVLGKKTVTSGDQVRIAQTPSLKLKSVEPSSLILIDVPQFRRNQQDKKIKNIIRRK
jgi:redox-sensitive bicupin YhaK (pirin superfamily)